MLIPEDDHRRALRLRRQLMAVYSYLLVWAGVALGMELGLFAPDTPHWWLFAAVLAANILIFLLIRSGQSQRWHDPALTIPQMMVGVLLVTVLLHYASELRGGLLALYFMVMTFGVFALDRRRMLVMSLFTLACFTAMEVLEAFFHPERFVFRVSFGHWGILAMGLLWFVFVGGYIHNLQEKYRQQRVSLETVNRKLQQAMKRLEDIAIHDDLTGLFNRRYFLERLDEDLARAERTERPFHVALLDLDHFKAINDTHGHHLGDQVLREFASRAREQLRRTDLLARYGGEEFVVLFPHGDTEDIRGALERLRRACEAIELPEAPQAAVSVSAGAACWHPGDTSDSLLRRADAALYQAKDQGRNRVVEAE